jgi:hypothetical protein
MLVSLFRTAPHVLCLAAASLVACSSSTSSSGTGGNSSSTSGTDGNSSSGTGGNSSDSGEAATPGDCLTKFDLLSATPGSEAHGQICAAAGAGNECDICVAAGYLGDYECDQALIDAGYCAGPDPDCTLEPADIYVAPGGDDGGAGSEADPFETVQRAIDSAQPGDVIVLRGGTYTPPDRTLFNMSGTAVEPIIIRSAPADLVLP